MKDKWLSVEAAPRDGTPIILWIVDDEASPAYPITVGVFETDDMMGMTYWRVFGARYGTDIYFDQNIKGWKPLPRIPDA